MRDILKALNQRPIVYYPIYAQIAGGVKAGLVLSQLMYWFSVCKNDKFYKTDDEIISELQLNEREFREAKAKLKELDFLKISREGLPAKTYYEIDWEKYENTLKNVSQTSSDKTSELETTKRPNTTRQNVRTRNDKTSELYNRYTEMTTENTKEMTTENLTPLPPLPHFLDPKLWQDFLNYQKERGWHFSAMGVDMCFRDWTKWHNEGIDVNECIRASMRNGYKGVFKTQAQNKSTQINLNDYVKFGLDPTLLGGFIETKEAEWIECK